MRSRTGINISFHPAALVIYAVLVLCPFSSAYANYEDVESYSYDFLVETAEAADVTPNEFVFNYVFTSNVITGQNMTDETGMSLSEDVETNLSHMRETEDYPNWDKLPQEWKTRWGTPTNYYASKFNHLYAAGSGGRGYEDDMSSFEGSGGDDFTWTDAVHDNIVSLGNKFKKFLLGDANSVAELLENFLADGKQNIESYMAVPSYSMYDGSQIEGWPSTIPTNIPVSYGYITWAFDQTYNRNSYLNTSTSTLRLMLYNQVGSQIGNYAFSKTTFKYDQSDQGTPTRLSAENVTTSAYNQNVNVYRARIGTTNNGSGPSSLPLIQYSGNNINSDVTKVAALILYGSDDVNMPSSVPIIDYPDTLQTNVNIYMPDNVDDSTTWINYTTPPENTVPGTDLSAVLTVLRRIENQLGLLDRTSEDLTTLETAIAQFQFYTGGILKVHDVGVFDSLTDIGSDIHDILTTLVAWPKGDAPDAPDIIGDFDFDELQDKSDLLLESVSDLAPFGALLLMSEMVGILSQTGSLAEPEFVIPFEFMPGHDYDVTIDLSWLENGRVYINFFCILSLIMCLLNITIRIIELEAAS